MPGVHERVSNIASLRSIDKHPHQEQDASTVSSRSVREGKSSRTRPRGDISLDEYAVPLPRLLSEKRVVVATDQFRKELFNMDAPKTNTRSNLREVISSIKRTVGGDSPSIELDPEIAAAKVLSKLGKSSFDASSFLRAAYKSVKLLQSGRFVSEAVNQLEIKEIRTLYKHANSAKFVNLHETVMLLGKNAANPNAAIWANIDKLMTTLAQELEHNMDLAEIDKSPYVLADYTAVQLAQDVLPENVVAISSAENWVRSYNEAFDTLYGDKLRQIRFEQNRQVYRQSLSASSSSASSSSDSSW